MLQQFLNHIEQNSLCDKNHTILLATSGGVDSMVMMDLFVRGGYKVAVAHCNFQLRGGNADSDEALVRATAERAGVPFHVARFDTQDYAWSKNVSIQVAARELRYHFFNSLLEKFGYDVVATAHHLNDSIETVLLNLTRGTGIDGLTGIPARNGRTIRPLLCFPRKAIYDYAVNESITWREDESNLSDHYTRNIIRHQVIPILQSINADFEANFGDTLERISGTRILSRNELRQIEKASVSQEGEKMIIRKSAFTNREFPAVVLWELVKSRGFHYHECKEIMREHQPGKIFNSRTHRLVVDREALIVTPNVQRTEVACNITKEDSEVINGKQRLKLTHFNAENFALQKTKNVAQLDMNKIRFPLSWRSWHAGDSFSPLGMQTHKKISDFLIDLKVSRIDKEGVTVLESDGEIVWVVGYRISDKVKVTDATRSILQIEWQEIL